MTSQITDLIDIVKDSQHRMTSQCSHSGFCAYTCSRTSFIESHSDGLAGQCSVQRCRDGPRFDRFLVILGIAHQARQFGRSQILGRH